MKKYSMFIFCLIFAVCLTSYSCSKKKGSSNNVGRQRQLYSENPNGSPASNHVNEVQCLVNQVGEDTKFIFEKYEHDEDNNKCWVYITHLDDNNKPLEKLVVSLNIASSSDELDLRNNAMVIATFNDNNNLFAVVDIYDTNLYIDLFYGTNSDCILTEWACDNSASVLQKQLSEVSEKKYWIIKKDVHDTNSTKTVHPYWVVTSKTPL
jgi:hypothetical protein